MAEIVGRWFCLLCRLTQICAEKKHFWKIGVKSSQMSGNRHNMRVWCLLSEKREALRYRLKWVVPKLKYFGVIGKLFNRIFETFQRRFFWFHFKKSLVCSIHSLASFSLSSQQYSQPPSQPEQNKKKNVRPIIPFKTGRSGSHSLGLENFGWFFKGTAGCGSDVSNSFCSTRSNHSESRHGSLGYSSSENLW